MRTLKKARKLLDCTQEQLAVFVGVTTKTMRNLEIGRTHNPQRVKREKFEKKLGLINWDRTFLEGCLNTEKHELNENWVKRILKS